MAKLNKYWGFVAVGALTAAAAGAVAAVITKKHPHTKDEDFTEDFDDAFDIAFDSDEEEEKEAPQESAEDFESWDADLEQGDITETDEEPEGSDDVEADTIQDAETDTDIKADVKADTDAE